MFVCLQFEITFQTLDHVKNRDLAQADMMRVRYSACMRLREIRNEREYCTGKIKSQWAANTSRLRNEVEKRLDNLQQLIELVNKKLNSKSAADTSNSESSSESTIHNDSSVSLKIYLKVYLNWYTCITYFILRPALLQKLSVYRLTVNYVLCF